MAVKTMGTRRLSFVEVGVAAIIGVIIVATFSERFIIPLWKIRANGDWNAALSSELTHGNYNVARQMHAMHLIRVDATGPSYARHLELSFEDGSVLTLAVRDPCDVDVVDENGLPPLSMPCSLAVSIPFKVRYLAPNGLVEAGADVNREQARATAAPSESEAWRINARAPRWMLSGAKPTCTSLCAMREASSTTARQRCVVSAMPRRSAALCAPQRQPRSVREADVASLFD